MDYAKEYYKLRADGKKSNMFRLILNKLYTQFAHQLLAQLQQPILRARQFRKRQLRLQAARALRTWSCHAQALKRECHYARQISLISKKIVFRAILNQTKLNQVRKRKLAQAKLNRKKKKLRPQKGADCEVQAAAPASAAAPSLLLHLQLQAPQALHNFEAARQLCEASRKGRQKGCLRLAAQRALARDGQDIAVASPNLIAFIFIFNNGNEKVAQQARFRLWQGRNLRRPAGKHGHRLQVRPPLRTLTYTPTKKVLFDSSDRSLLYYYKPTPWAYMFQYSLYMLPMGFLARLIKYNPFYLTFPAALPIMFTIETWLAIRLYKKFKYLRHVVSAVYLSRDGQTLEIHYEKQFWRKIKDENTRLLFYIPNLKTVQREDSKPLKGNLIPTEWPIEKQPLRQFSWSYVKYYMNQNNYFVLPLDCNYVNPELLVAVFNGKLINTAKQNVQEIEGSMAERVLRGEIASEDNFY